MKKFIIIPIIVLLFSYCQIQAQDDRTVMMTKEELVSAGGLRASFEKIDSGLKNEIVTYTVSVMKAGFCMEYRISGTDKFTEQVISAINASERKQRIIFENIKVKLEDGRIKKLLPIIVIFI